ncbi:MAG: caspase family protein [Pseudomonadota bacterium]
MSRLIALVCLVATLSLALPAAAGDRLALVVGNAEYRNVPALANPVNDAQLIAGTLREAGFAVTMILDADRAEMTRAVDRFGRDLGAAAPGTFALFYFAGHGVRSDGFNYLVPIDVNIRSEADIASETVAAEWVLGRIDAPGITSVMVLDACRDNPFDGRGPGAFPELGDGLARMTARNSNLVAYATGPGDVALDGAGTNSPYTAALARAIRTPGLDVEGIFQQVRDEVVTATDGLQVPWESSALDRAVYIQADRAPLDDPAEGPLLRLAIAFSPGRWGGGSLGCGTLYRYAPISLPAAAGSPQRLTAVNGDGGVAIEVTTRQGSDGLELNIIPVAAAESGRPVAARLSDITSGGEHALYSRSRHPALFGCGPMTVYVNSDG